MSRLLAAVAAMLLLVACDPVTYAEIVIDAKKPLDACLSSVEHQLRAADGIKVAGSVADSRQIQVARGSDSISILLETASSTRVRMSFK